MSQIRNAVLIACSLAAVSGQAHAEDQATIHRLSSHGGLSSAAAKRLSSKVSQRMARAADAPPTVMDPLRAALSQALVGSPMPMDAMATAKVRLKLYAGLNEVALEALFAPKPGAIAACERDVGASHSECEALVAAAADSSVAKIRKVAGGPAPMPMMAAAPPVQPGYGASGMSHFGGGYNSGFQGQGAPAPQQQQQGFGGGYHPPAYQQQPQGYGNAPGYAAAQPMQQGYAPQQQYAPRPQQQYAPRPQQQYAPAPAYAARPPVQQQAYAAPQQPAYRPAPVAAAPAAAYVAPPPAAPVVSAQDVAARKEAYKLQREQYLARQKAEFQQRKDKSAGLETNPDNAPPPAKTAAAAPMPAKAAGKVTAPAAEEVAAADTKHPVAAAAPEAPAAKAEAKPALDNSFLDGLLDDPLGGKKK
jgi:hypothetical protein